MKKRLTGILAVSILLFLALAAWAAVPDTTIVLKIGDPYMTVNGVRQEIDPGRGTKPVVIERKTLLPIRTIVESVYGTVYWLEDTQQVVTSVYEKTVTLTIGSKTAEIKDNISSAVTSVLLDVAPRVINDRTMVPIRFVSENLGAKADWNESQQLVTVIFGKGSSDTPDSHGGAGSIPAHEEAGSGNDDTCTECHADKR